MRTLLSVLAVVGVGEVLATLVLHWLGPVSLPLSLAVGVGVVVVVSAPVLYAVLESRRGRGGVGREAHSPAVEVPGASGAGRAGAGSASASGAGMSGASTGGAGASGGNGGNGAGGSSAATSGAGGGAQEPSGSSGVDHDFRAMLDAVADGVVLVDGRGRIGYANRQMERILGYLPGELVGQGVEMLVPPSVRDLHASQREGYEDKPVPRPMGLPLELTAVRKDGVEVPVSISLSPIETVEGRQTLAILTDLSALVSAWHEADLLRRAVEQSGEIVVVTDLDGTIDYVNPAFERVTGYSRAEAVGKTPRILKSGRHDEWFYKRMYATLERGDVWRAHFVNRRKDGTLYDQYASISRVLDRSGRPVCYVAVGRDITSELELEAQLRQSQKMDALGRLAGGVAHDFNNILTAIAGHAEMALEGGEDSQADLEEIVRAAQRAAELTRHLLTFSRKQPGEAKVMDLNAVVGQTQRMLRRLLGEHIQLRTELSGGREPVEADPGQIEQVILNLAVNARDAMPSGGTLRLSTYRVSETAVPRDGSEGERRVETYVALDVHDTGEGMDREVLARIFEPFYTTKAAGKGTGLGLAMVYGIVRHFDGTIAVDSRPGEGTRFTVYLPLLEAGA